MANKFTNFFKNFTNSGVPKTYPLIFPEKNICLFFSAKSGCTFATKWIFYQMDLLDEALAFNSWIHKYRRMVYYKQDFYTEELKNIYSDKYIRIKLVRSPYQRAVSSYIHAIKRNYANDEISEILDRKLTDNKRYSFEEFISYLERIDLTKCNPHHRIQTLPDELTGKLSFNHTIKLENSYTAFREIEEKYDLKKSNLGSLARSDHHRIKIHSSEYNGDRILGKNDKQFHEFQTYYNDYLKDKVIRLYQKDFSCYQYDIDEI